MAGMLKNRFAQMDQMRRSANVNGAEVRKFLQEKNLVCYKLVAASMAALETVKQEVLVGDGDSGAGIRIRTDEVLFAAAEAYEKQGERGKITGAAQRIYIAFSDVDKLEEKLVATEADSRNSMKAVYDGSSFHLARIHCGVETNMKVVDALWGLEEVYAKGPYDERCALATDAFTEELKQQCEGVGDNPMVQITRQPVKQGHSTENGEPLFGYVLKVPEENEHLRKIVVRDFDYQKFADKIGAEEVELVDFTEYANRCSSFQLFLFPL